MRVRYAWLLVVGAITVPMIAATQTRDSAGVRIVALRLPPRSSPAPVALADTPSLVLGESSGDPNQEFSDVAAAARLADGTTVVVNRATNELRFFDAHGKFLRVAGRRGKGPGEFTNITAFALLPDDSLMVQDWSTSRVAVFSSHGALARTFALGPPPQRPRAALVGAFTDQTLFGAGSDYLTNTNPPPGIFTLTQTLFTFSPAGTALRPLKTMLERQFVFVAMPGNEAAARYVRPFGAIGTIRVAGDNYLVGDGSRFEIFEYSLGGRLLRVLRVSVPRRRITRRTRQRRSAVSWLSMVPRRRIPRSSASGPRFRGRIACRPSVVSKSIRTIVSGSRSLEPRATRCPCGSSSMRSVASSVRSPFPSALIFARSRVTAFSACGATRMTSSR